MERVELALPGGRFEAIAAGRRGDPLVVCLHGFPDVPETFLEGGLLPALADAGYFAVAPWLRGYAPSTLAGPHDADRLGLDLVEVVDALSGGRPARVVGHDWGAVAAYVALSTHPERFARAVTMAVPHPLAFLGNLPRHPAQLRRSAYMAFFQLPALPEGRVPRDDFAYVRALWRAWSPGLAPPDAHLRRVVACLGRSFPAPLGHYRAMLRPPGAALARLRAAARPDRRIPVPTLQLQGTDDGCIGLALRRGQERYFAPGALAQGIVPGAGHFLHLERPVEVADRVARWLAEPAPPPA